MRKIGLFGGSFNPVHIAHLILAERVREEAELDRVVFIPARRPPHKPDLPLAPASHRLEMLERAIEGHPDFEVSTVEFEREGPSYTLRTVRAFHEEVRGDGEPHLILGGDSVLDLPNWWHAEELVREANIVAVERPGYLLDDLSVVRDAFGDEVAACIRRNRVEIPLMDLSATDIRRRARQGLSIRYLVPEPVRTCIHENQLYSDSTTSSPDR